jgi:amylosucrase
VRRTSGTAASLAGIEAAAESGDAHRIALAINRYMCAYAMVFGWGGIPLLYMGDEIGLFNDYDYVNDPLKAADSRWINRPKMDWTAGEAAASGSIDWQVPGQIRNRMQRLIDARKSLPQLHAATNTVARCGRGAGIILFERHHPAGNLLQIYNLNDSNRWVGADEMMGMNNWVIDALTGEHLDARNGLQLHPYQSRWLVLKA